MSSISRQWWILVSIMVWMVTSTPILVMRRQQSDAPEVLRALEKLIGEEQRSREGWALVLPVRQDRMRRHVPDGYFDEFSADSFSSLPGVMGGSASLPRHRRAQPILDQTDEFSADPFEIPVLPETALIARARLIRLP